MFEKPYFVMLWMLTTEGMTAVPLVGEDDEVMFFASHNGAEEEALKTLAGSQQGYDVFELDA